MHRVDGIAIVCLIDHQLFDERTVREAADQIAINLPADGTPIKLISDISGVTLVSINVLSKLISIQRMVEETLGHMSLCELSPIPQQVFRTSNLDRLLQDRSRPAEFHRSPKVTVLSPPSCLRLVVFKRVLFASRRGEIAS